MNDLILKDLEYTAIRFSGGLSHKTVKDISEQCFIKSHRDINLDTLKDIVKHNTDINAKTREAVNKIIFKEDQIKKSVDLYVKSIKDYGIDVISCLDKAYPAIWNGLSGMPKVIFTKGDTSIINNCYMNGSAAIVGSRTPSHYALYATGQFTKELTNKNVVIVSGGAIGVDRCAHESALDNGGQTIAVSPCGLDIIYPFKNMDIYERIYNTGLVLSELPPGQQAIKQYFPARNRLISALSDVCLVMEAGLFSGTLHTASFSANFGRDVFVLPNNIYVENCHGGLKLLKDGAEILLNSEEVLSRIAGTVYERLRDELYRQELERISRSKELRKLAKSVPDSLSSDEWKLLICEELSVKPKTIDDISMILPIPFAYLSTLVSELELSGKIENEAGKYFLTFKQC